MMNRDMRVVYADLPAGVKAFTVLKDDYYTIVLNQNLTREQNEVSYQHELHHIINNDFEKADVQKIETKAHERRTIWQRKKESQE